jgi:hypothetical protein
MPLIRYTMDPEAGHHAAVRFLSLPRWARPRDRGVDGQELQAEVCTTEGGMRGGWGTDEIRLDIWVEGK